MYNRSLELSKFPHFARLLQLTLLTARRDAQREIRAAKGGGMGGQEHYKKGGNDGKSRKWNYRGRSASPGGRGRGWCEPAREGVCGETMNWSRDLFDEQSIIINHSGAGAPGVRRSTPFHYHSLRAIWIWCIVADDAPLPFAPRGSTRGDGLAPRAQNKYK